MKDTRWDIMLGKILLPRMWLRLEQESLALSWALITQVRASPDFLSISFLCEFGLVELSSSEPMQALFEELQMERVRYIRLPACLPPDPPGNSLEFYTVRTTRLRNTQQKQPDQPSV